MANFMQIAVIIALLVGIIGFVTGVSGALYTWMKTGDVKPFFESTIGATLLTDKSIGDDTGLYLSTQDPKLKSIIKRDLLISLFLLLFIFFIFYIIVRTVLPQSDLLTRSVVFLFLIAIFFSASMIYIYYSNKTLYIPFSGMFELIKNFKTIFIV